MRKALTTFLLLLNTVFAQKTQWPVEPCLVSAANFSREPCEIVIDLSDNTCILELPDRTVKFWAEGSDKGIGFERGSNKTPTGSFLFIKQSAHRYGKVLRLTGPAPTDVTNPNIESGWYQGWKRGILVHKDYGSGSKGCVNLHKDDMNKLYKLVIPNYDKITINP